MQYKHRKVWSSVSFEEIFARFYEVSSANKRLHLQSERRRIKHNLILSDNAKLNLKLDLIIQISFISVI